MKLSYRVPVIMATILLLYFLYRSNIDPDFYTDTNVDIQTTKTKRVDNANAIAKKGSTRKKVSYKQRKTLMTKRLNALVVQQNISELVKKRPSKKRKTTKEIDNGNYRLNGLIFQMWDPHNYQDQGSMLNCDNLVSTDEKSYRQGRRFARKLNRKFYEYVNVSEIYETIRHSCVSVLNVFKYRTPKFSAASYPIAYTITLDRTAEQSLRLLASIYHHDNVYCVHPNAKFGTVYFNVFKKLSECVPNIVLPDKIFGIRVKTYNRLRAQLACFKKLLNSTVPWRYGLNLPSSSFPLRNNTYIVQYLKQKSYENVVPWEVPTYRFEKRYKYTYVVKEIEGETLLLRTTIKKNPPPTGLTIFRKGEHFISTRDFWRFLTETELAKAFLEWARDTKNPEDFYYATLNRYRDAPGGYPYIEDDLQEQGMLLTTETENVSDIPPSDLLVNLWKSDHRIHCHGVYRGYMCIFGAGDLRWLLQQDNLFAFSFDFRVDRVAIDCLTKHLQNPILKEYKEELE